MVGVAWHVEEVSPRRGQRFVNYMIGRVKGGSLALGSDRSCRRTSRFCGRSASLSREEIGQLEHVYPKFFNDEIWGILKEEQNGMTYYKLRYNE